jgi:hypothetical protein
MQLEERDNEKSEINISFMHSHHMTRWNFNIVMHYFEMLKHIIKLSKAQLRPLFILSLWFLLFEPSVHVFSMLHNQKKITWTINFAMAMKYASMLILFIF